MSKKHYLLVMWDGGGAVPPELAVARRLLEAGNQVSILGEESMRTEVEAAGCRFLPYRYAPNRPNRLPESDPFPDWNGQSPFKILHALLYGQATAYARDVVESCQENQFDQVLIDGFLPGAMIGVEAVGKPFSVLWPAIDIIPHAGRPPDGLGLMPGKDPVSKVRDFLLNQLFRTILQSGKKEINTLRESYGLSKLKHPFHQYQKAEKVLILSSRHFDYPTQLPSNTFYGGPQLTDPHWAEPVELHIPGPYILVSLGSTFQNQKDLYIRLMETLSQLPLPAVVTLGNVFDPKEFGHYPNIHILKAAAHHSLLPECGLVINHGGHGIVMKSIMAGLPQLVIPLGRDQFGNAGRVVYHGLGMKAKRNSKPEELARKIKRLLSDESFGEKVRLMAEKIKTEITSDPIGRYLLNDQDHLTS
ncbi:MAG: glycosyltransferase [Saprospiraceae bacterium]|nr:glycosyltransferase family 1 protein [Lewinella sp.]